MNTPGPTTCPRCGAAAERMPSSGDYQEYRCPSPGCGTYRIAGTVEKEIENGVYEAKDTHLIESGGHKWAVR